jgi:four helix bundle protein
MKGDGRQETGDRSATRTAPARNFQALLVWQKAHALVLAVYRFTDAFPAKEVYTLTSQSRRAAISVPANIAEGFKKKGPADKLRFLNIAQGSLEECGYYLILAGDLGYGDGTALLLRLDEVSRLLDAYSRSLARNHNLLSPAS